VTETEPLADRPDLVAELRHMLGNREATINAQRRIICELYDATNNLLAYKYCLADRAGRKETDAGITRAIDNCDRVLANVKFLRESEADIERAKQVNTMFDAVLGRLK
jgi:hypothetical protein